MNALRQDVYVRASVHVEPGAEISVNPPRTYEPAFTGGPGRVPWVVDFQTSYGHGGVSLTVATRELLVQLRDKITATLDAHPDES
jgi:hypothetical protein